MYDPIKLQERMAELGLNFPRVAKLARVDPKTAKSIITTGKGYPDKVEAVAKVLKFKLPEIVKRQPRSEDNGDEAPRRRKKAS